MVDGSKWKRELKEVPFTISDEKAISKITFHSCVKQLLLFERLVTAASDLKKCTMVNCEFRISAFKRISLYQAIFMAKTDFL